MTNSKEHNDFSGAERWRELDILDQKQLLEVSTRRKCPLSDEELIEKQKQGWYLSEAGLYLRREKWHKDIKEASPVSRGGLPTVREVLFQLVPDFARMPVEDRVSFEFTESGGKVHDIMSHSAGSLGVVLARRFVTPAMERYTQKVAEWKDSLEKDKNALVPVQREAIEALIEAASNQKNLVSAGEMALKAGMPAYARMAYAAAGDSEELVNLGNKFQNLGELYEACETFIASGNRNILLTFADEMELGGWTEFAQKAKNAAEKIGEEDQKEHQ